jgi:hypothetical protein
MTTTKPVTRSLVSLKLPRSVPDVISLAKAVVQSMTNNASFPTPDPPLATVTTALTALETAETATQARTRGAATTRNEKLKALVTLLEQTKAYIQKIADSNVETSASVIESAGVGVRKPFVRQKQTFQAEPGAISGAVKLTAAVTDRRASYEWQYSLDGGKTWTAMPTTLQSRTTVSGMTPGATVMFHYRAVTKAGEGNWSQPTSLIVK